MERRERVRFWGLVGTNNGVALCEAGWRYRLGDLAWAFERYLDDAGAPAETYPPLYRGEPEYRLVPGADGKYRVDPFSGAHESEDAPWHMSEKEEELFARRFKPDEVQGKRLAVDRLLGEACEALGILPGVQTRGERFFRLGTRARRSVFLYLGGGVGLSESLAAHLASAGSDVELYVAQKTAEVETCGMLADVAVVEIGSQLDVGKDGRFISVDRKAGKGADRDSAAGSVETGVNVVKDGAVLEFGSKTYSFKGEKRWDVVTKLIRAKGKYVPLGKGIKALFAKHEQALAFFDAAVEAEGQGINGTGRYRLKI